MGTSADDGHRHTGTDAAPRDEPAHRTVGEADAAVRNRGAENASDVVEPVQSDLARPAREFLDDVGARAQGEGERRSDRRRVQVDRLFDEEVAERGRRRRLAHDRLEDPDRVS